MDSSAPPALDGLRALLGEWEEQSNTAKKQVPKDECDTAMTSIYSQYQKMATQEDKDLVTRWTETLNILLTFAGLLSAIITAFLLASQSDLQPSPNASTNKILLHISRQLDNTTSVYPSLEETSNRTSSIRVLAFWHSSLGCSLLSAFGSLLSKQWVLHYQSNPIWVKSVEDQCHLREVRVCGLSKWQMHAIIDSLPVLLQLSVFLFYVGLAESIHFIPALFTITLIFAGSMATLYSVTLIAGAFAPSCPFKSPITSLSYKGAVFVALTCKVSLAIVVFIPFTILEGVFDRSVWRRNSIIAIDAWRLVGSFWQREDVRRDEQILMKKSHGMAGILFWWFQQSEGYEVATEAEKSAATEVAKSLPVDAVLIMSTWRRGFGDWCFRVLKALRSGSASRASRLEADVVCHLMHHSSSVVRVMQYGLTNYEWDYAGPKFYGYVCNSLRNGWTDSLADSSTRTPLPMLDMPHTTLAVYLRFQLLDWISNEKPESWSNLGLLLQELLAALKSDYYSDLDQHTDSLIDATSLAAIALVPEHTPQIKPMSGLVQSEQPERLLQAFHRLSHYPHHQSPNSLVPAAVTAAKRILHSANLAEVFYPCPSWKSGEFADSLYRLLKLGRVWWHAEVGEDNSNYGASLIYEIHLLMDLVMPHDVKAYQSGHLKILPLSPDNLGEILATYAHPDAPKQRLLEHRTEATGILDLTLSMRYLLLPFPNPPRLAWSKTPSFTQSLAEYPQVIRQLIRDIDTAPDDSRLRRASLSVVIKGRDMFLPDPVSSLFPSLAEEIDRLAEEMPQTSDFAYELSRAPYATFNRWADLLHALEELQRALGHPTRQEQNTFMQTVTVPPVPAPEDLATTTHVF